MTPQQQITRPTLFIECTNTSARRMNTGIQRVVRNVLRNAAAAASHYGYDVVPVAFSGGRFICFDLERIVGDRSHPPAVDDAVHPTLTQKAWRWLVHGLATLLPFTPVRLFLYAAKDQFGLAWCFLLPLRTLGLREWRSKPTDYGDSKDLDSFTRYDDSILLLLDASWGDRIWPAVAQFRQRGGKVVGVIYDIIPVTHPRTVTPEHTAVFRYWLRQHARHSDALIAISRSAADELTGWLAKQRTHGNRPVIGHFLLGSELDQIQTGDPVRSSIQCIFTPDQHVFLMVGAIEPRKNHGWVLDAFDAFWQGGGAATLLIIGRHSWKSEALLERVARHPQLGRQLFLLRDAADAELDHAYRNASALVIASEAEGFGLPVVEAFQRGLPVLCSDIPVFREIADGKANFFDLKDRTSIIRELARVCAMPPNRGAREPQTWLTWRESTEQLCAIVMRALGRPCRTDYDRSRTPGRLECQLP